MLQELPLARSAEPLPTTLERLHLDGTERADAISCFDFVPSDPLHLWQTLRPLSPGRFCEWGSGMGIGVGIAASLGWTAVGIEIHEELAEASRQLLADHRLSGRIVAASYLDWVEIADVYFVYCWPGRMREVRERFIESAPPGAQLLMAHGASDIRGYLLNRAAS